MERIDLYDRYINNQLSEKERAEFDARLESDVDFASDFKVFLLSVDGICREVHQDNLDFGLAMKSLSKAQLKEIIGKRSEEHQAAAAITASPRKVRPKAFRFSPWMWQAASIAAVIIIAFTVLLNIEKNARYSVDNAIYACAEINSDRVRAGGEVLNITTMTDEELKGNIPVLISNYNYAETTDEIADNGFALAMAYLRLHDRDNAKTTLQQLIQKFERNPDYAGYVSKWQSILNVLE